MVEVREILSDSLSLYRTTNRFIHYGEFTSPEQFLEYCDWARQCGLPVFILGNGSNTLFSSRTVRTMVLKNKLERTFEPLGNDLYLASSSMMIMTMLKYCRERRLDAPYYLASVPATVGGAIAMNAGRGGQWNASIFDFLHEVTWVEDGEIRTAKADTTDHTYRQTPFVGLHRKLIINGVFRFPASDINDDLIRQRIDYTKESQDHSAPNCGSVFKVCHPGIMRRLRGLRLGKADYSPKTINWILNRAANPIYIRSLIAIGKLAHAVVGKSAIPEIIQVK
ncbi:MAG: FAD-binding protein [Gammaproteobacteria bacterium]|nr:FAD-binding protein [Gammaproteobacteria bacterium]